MSRHLLALLLLASAAACGAPADEEAPASGDPTATTAEEDGAISQRTPAFVRLRRDLRRCVAPLCGGYWLTDLNRTTAEVYVSGLDLESEATFDEATREQITGSIDELVLRGHLGALERRFNTRTLVVSEAYRGLPGFTARATDRFYNVESNDPPIQCIAAPCNNDRAWLLNTGRAWSAFTGVDVRLVNVPFGDASWITAQVERHGALVAAHFEDGARLPAGRERLLVTSQVYVRIGVEAEACPLVRAAPCAAGEVYVSARSADRCLYPNGCAPAGQACPAFAPSRAEGYTLASWDAAPTGCPAFACDPTFSLAAQPVPRCHHVRCSAGFHCENEGPVACVPDLTCASMLCAPGHHCVDAPEGSVCIADEWVPEAVALASRNPYANNTRQAWVFTSDLAGSTVVRLHFTRFDLERGYDFVIVETTDGAELARYTGALGEFTTDPFIGTAVRIRFETDASVTRPGFAIDRIEVRR